MTRFSIRTIEDLCAWEAIVDSSHASTVFHSTAWCAPKSLLILEHRGKIVGGIPTRHEGHVSGKPPLVPYGGPLFTSHYDMLTSHKKWQAHQELAQAYAHVGRMDRFCTSPWSPGIEGWIPLGYTAQQLFTCVVDIEYIDDVRRRFYSPLERSLGAAQRSGVVTRQTHELGLLTRAVEATFQRQRRDPWFDVAWLSRRIELFLASGCSAIFATESADGQPLAAVAIVWDHRRSYYIAGGRDSRTDQRGALATALFAAMEYSSTILGRKEFDLEGSNQQGIANFFAGFGGRWMPYHIVQHTGRNAFDS